MTPDDLARAAEIRARADAATALWLVLRSASPAGAGLPADAGEQLELEAAP